MIRLSIIAWIPTAIIMLAVYCPIYWLIKGKYTLKGCRWFTKWNEKLFLSPPRAKTD